MEKDYGEIILEEMSLSPKFSSWSIDLVSSWLSGRVLEIGCGIGSNLPYIRKFVSDVFVTDFNQNYLHHVVEKKLVNSKNAILWDITKSPPTNFPEIDTVFCSNVIEHIKDDKHVLRNISQIPGLKNLIMIVPANEWLMNKIDWNLGHYRRYSKSQIKSLFKDTDFEINKIFSFNKVGVLGWFFQGVFGNSLGKNNIILYNKLMPIIKFLDPIIPINGLSMVIIGELND